MNFYELTFVLRADLNPSEVEGLTKEMADIAVAQGATITVDGRTLTTPSGGFFLAGTLFDHVKPDMKIYCEEIFGPVLAVIRAKNLDDAFQIANGTKYASPITRPSSRWNHSQKKIDLN